MDDNTQFSHIVLGHHTAILQMSTQGQKRSWKVNIMLIKDHIKVLCFEVVSCKRVKIK